MMQGIKRMRRLKMGLRTLMGSRPEGFFIPYRYAAEMPPPGSRAAYDTVAARFDASGPAFDAWLDRLDGFAAGLLAIGGDPPPAPRWGQDWFCGLDAAIAYTIVRHSRPDRIVEVGSGHSTRFMARAVADARAAEAPSWLPVFTAIDPAPRASIEALDLTLLRKTVDKAPGNLFRMLQAGDILFLDSSHILMPGSDVDLLLNHILPGLAPGVLVHVHDIFLPWDYPADWAWRGYNEQLALVPLLAFGGFEPVFASRFVRQTRGERIAAGALGRLDPPAGPESSLWMVRTG